MLILHRLPDEEIIMRGDIRLRVMEIGKREVIVMLTTPVGMPVSNIGAITDAVPDDSLLQPTVKREGIAVYMFPLQFDKGVRIGLSIEVKLYDIRHSGAGIGIEAPREIEITRPDAVHKKSTKSPQPEKGLETQA